MDYRQYSEDAITIYLGDEISPDINMALVALKQRILDLGLEGIEEIYQSYTSLVIYFDLDKTDAMTIKQALDSMKERESKGLDYSFKIVEIPVCYEGQYAMDLPDFKNSHGLSPEEVIDIHANKEYLVYMIGFMPGFPFLGGLDKRIHKQRLTVPRTLIPAGSVGIGGQQTGVYPFDSPGGWNLIGRTPIKIYDPSRGNDAILYQAGDRIIFRPISIEEYQRIEQEVAQGKFYPKITYKGDKKCQ